MAGRGAVLGDAFLETRFRLASQLRGFRLGKRARRLATGEEGRQDGIALHGPIGAALGDLHGVLDRLGQIGEQRPHLLGRLEIVVGAQAAPLVHRHVASLGDADQRVMGLEIVSCREEGLVGGDQRQRQVVRQADKLRLDRPLLRQAVALELHIEPVAEKRLQRLQTAARELRVAVGEREIDHPFGAASQRDQAVGMSSELIDRDERLARLGRREIGAGGEPHQIGVAGFVLGKERNAPVCLRSTQVRARGRLALRGEGQRQRAADDGLDARSGHGFGELKRAEQIVGIGQRQRRRAVGLGERHEPRDGERPFEQRIGRVHPEMHEGLGLLVRH